jgi:hypothetical protein
MAFKIVTRNALIRLAILFFVIAASLFVIWWTMLRMPGKSYKGQLPPLTASQKKTGASLLADVEMLSKTIGHRNVFNYGNLAKAADYIDQRFTKAGYKVNRIGYKIDGVQCDNLEVQITGTVKPDKIVIVGAHYDSVFGTPGANDNATGVAAMLELARIFAGKKPACTLRFVAFVNEEPPYFWTPRMGSLVYAKHCRQNGENIAAVIAFDCLGCYSDDNNSQKYPFPFSILYPSTGNFIGFVGNFSSRHLVREVLLTFREHAKFPSEGGAMFAAIPGVGWSDQWSFWQCGYKGIMVTDTAVFRYLYYHRAEDTFDKVDCDKLARVVEGLEYSIQELVGMN